MRFLHTADWHLGRLLYGVSLIQDQAFVLEEFVRLVRDSKPDAVVIAGDIYDQAAPPAEASQLLDDILSPVMLDCNTPVIMIAGNHDSPERLGFANKLLARQGMYVAGRLNSRPEPVIINDDAGPVYFLPVPYTAPSLVRSRLEQPEVAGHEQALRVLADRTAAGIPKKARSVVVAHAFLSGGQTSESERPLSTSSQSGMVSPKIFSGFQYAALGHLHTPQSVGKDNMNIRYAGSILPYSFAEGDQEKGVNMVEIGADGKTTVQWIPLQPRRRVRVLDGLLRDILLAAEGEEHPDDYVMAVLRDSEPRLEAGEELRKIYSNILHIERPGIDAADASPAELSEDRFNETKLFARFFQEAAGRELTAAEAAEIARLSGRTGQKDSGEVNP